MVGREFSMHKSKQLRNDSEFRGVDFGQIINNHMNLHAREVLAVAVHYEASGATIVMKR